jgi:hypothetical protein
MEVPAHLVVTEWWLTSFASITCSLAAVSVVIQGLSIQVVSTTWCFRETNWQYFATEEWQCIGKLSCFKENNVRLVICSNS